jgi:membrane protein implicated in regulation of membrane protease activity
LLPQALRSPSALLAVLGVIAWCVGVFLIYVPAGLITVGVSAVAAAYVIRYLEVKTNEDS